MIPDDEDMRLKIKDVLFGQIDKMESTLVDNYDRILARLGHADMAKSILFRHGSAIVDGAPYDNIRLAYDYLLDQNFLDYYKKKFDEM